MVDSNLPMKVQLFISAQNLPNKDKFSNSDLFCIVWELDPCLNTYEEVGRTGRIKSNFNLNWTSTVIIDYYFEKRQTLKLLVYECDEDSPNELGDVDTSLGDIISKGTLILDLSLQGKIIIKAVEVNDSQDSYEVFLKGVHLDKKDTFGKSDPYLIFYRLLETNSWVEVYRTEFLKRL